jgi:CubicO group peptidase (beta-lactamase class C family)
MNLRISLALLGLGAGCLASAADGQAPVLPDTPPARLAGELLKLCEAPQLHAITQWLRDHMGQQVPPGFLEFAGHDIFLGCRLDGGWRVQAVGSSSADALQMDIVGRKSGISYRMRIRATPEGKILGLGSSPAVPPEDSIPQDLSDAAIRHELQQRISLLSAADVFSGIVLVARGDKKIVDIRAGYADRAKRKAFRDRTQFTIGSMGKMFTAVGLGQLVDQHRVSFTDTVGHFFPDYPNQTVRDKVTVGMLLSHTAGLGDFLAKRTPDMLKNGVHRAAEFMPLYDQDEPQFEPGSRWAYSNAGLALAGAILEQASGEDYPDYLRRHVFAPAGMTDSDPNNIPLRSARLVTPYTHQSASGPSATWQEAPRDIGSPAGGAVSTARDLLRFATALRSGKLVSPATLNEMLTAHGEVPGGGQYGYGIDLENVFGSTVVGHSGGFPGVSTHLYIFHAPPYAIVVLSNLDPPAEAYAATEAVGLVAERVKRERSAAAAGGAR